jgi:probable HAF family extracellular repeat protein
MKSRPTFFLSLMLAFSAFLPSALRAAFSYTVTDLGTLGGTESHAAAVNDYGLAVGTDAPETTAKPYAFLHAEGVRYDLNTLVDLSGSNFTQLSDATAISNTGYIVGTGTTTGGNTHAYLLTPIPAP